MILKNRTNQMIHSLIRENGKLVHISIPARHHSREFARIALTQQVLSQVNRGYLLIYEEPLHKEEYSLPNPNPKPVISTVIENVQSDTAILKSPRKSRRV